MPFNDLQIEQQEFSNWCWAACTKFICSWHDENFSETQRQIVAEVLDMPSCAVSPSSSACNETCDLAESLEFYKHLQQSISNILTAEVLSEQFQRSKAPIGCQMQIPGVGGHAVVITDVQKTSTSLFLTVSDPGDGSILNLDYETFKSDYRGNGASWVRTYLTV